MFQFAWLYVFIALPLPWIFWRLRPLGREGGAIFAPLLVRQGETHTKGVTQRPGTRHLVLIIAWLLLLGAAARPQWLGDLTSVPTSGRSLMLAVDVSGSMKATDLDASARGITRLDVVKTLGREFLERRNGDRVGLILFGTNAYLQAPMTFDRATVGTLLDEALIGIAGERTAIGDALGLAIKRLREANVKDKVLVLMTDGANTAGNVKPRDAAQFAASSGVRIHTVGIGADRMQVQGLLGPRLINPSSDLDEPLLREMAQMTGGVYFRAKSGEGLEAIYQQLDELEPVPVADESSREIKEYFHWPLTVLAILMLAWMAYEVRLKWRGRLQADQYHAAGDDG